MTCFFYREGTCLALPPERFESSGIFFRQSVPIHPKCHYNTDIHVRVHGRITVFAGMQSDVKMSDCSMYKHCKA